MTDVDEVVGTETDEGEEEVPFVEPPNRFDKIKESYKGVTTALDLSEETAAYEDFQSLLTGQKVRYSSLAVLAKAEVAAAHASSRVRSRTTIRTCRMIGRALVLICCTGF